VLNLAPGQGAHTQFLPFSPLHAGMALLSFMRGSAMGTGPRVFGVARVARDGCYRIAEARVSLARNQTSTDCTHTYTHAHAHAHTHTHTPTRRPSTQLPLTQTQTSIMSLPKNAHVSTHPCLQAKLSQLRSASTGSRDAQTLVHEIALMIGYEALGAGLTAQQDGTVCGSFLSLICCDPGIP
jgi:hypothetical protein